MDRTFDIDNFFEYLKLELPKNKISFAFDFIRGYKKRMIENYGNKGFDDCDFIVFFHRLSDEIFPESKTRRNKLFGKLRLIGDAFILIDE